MTKPPLKPAVFRLAALVFWSVLILWLSLSPSPPSPPPFFSWDKVQHAGAYAVLTFFAGRLLLLYARTPTRGWFWAMVASVFFGALVEMAQEAITSVRTGDPADLLANFCGAALVAAAGAGYHAWRGCRSAGRRA